MDDIWPALPIVIRTSNDRQQWVEEYTHNIITALEHNDRVSEISFHGVPDWILESFVAVMKEPFPFLTSLRIRRREELALVLPDFFLGGSAPRLRSLHLILWHFRHYEHFSHQLVTSRSFPSGLQAPGTFHPTRWSLACLRQPDSRASTLIWDHGLFPQGPRRPDTHCPPRSYSLFVEGNQWVLERPPGLDRCPSTLLNEDGVRLSVHAPRLHKLPSSLVARRGSRSPIEQISPFSLAQLSLSFSPANTDSSLPIAQVSSQLPRPLWPLSYLVQTCHSSFFPCPLWNDSTLTVYVATPHGEY
jgi:hypothetical protein